MIQSEKEYELVYALIDILVNRTDALSTAALVALSDLIDAYDDTYCIPELPDPEPVCESEGMNDE